MHILILHIGLYIISGTVQRIFAENVEAFVCFCWSHKVVKQYKLRAFSTSIFLTNGNFFAFIFDFAKLFLFETSRSAVAKVKNEKRGKSGGGVHGI